VQQDISDIYVTQDGTVYSIVFWDEAGAEVTVYKDGNVTTIYEKGSSGHSSCESMTFDIAGEYVVFLEDDWKAKES